MALRDARAGDVKILQVSNHGDRARLLIENEAGSLPAPGAKKIPRNGIKKPKRGTKLS